MGAEKSKLRPNDVKALAEQTDFTEKEIKTWYNSFNNDCPSGRLTLNEFKNMYKNFFPDGDVTSFAQHAFRTFDKNNDGSIDFREFLTALSVMSRGTLASKLEWAFNIYDLDNDGYVTKEEMLEIINAIQNMMGKKLMSQVATDGLTPEQRVEKIFSKIDKDKDQQISAEEFKKAAADDASLVMILQVGGVSE